MAIQLLKEECPAGSDPLGPENSIIFAVGPFTGLFPLASKTVAMFNPLIPVIWERATVEGGVR